MSSADLAGCGQSGKGNTDWSSAVWIEGVRRLNKPYGLRTLERARAAAAGIPPSIIGIVLMVVAMLVIPIVDTTAKYLSQTLPVLYVSFIRYAACAVIIVPVAMMIRGPRRVFPTSGLPMHFLRTGLLVGAMTSFFVAISVVPLADAMAAYFFAPIIASLLAVFVLKEKLSFGRLAGAGLGLIGTLLVVQPGGAMEPAILFAVLTGFLFGGYVVATRAAALSSGPLETLTFQCVFGAILLVPLALTQWGMPTPTQWLLIGMMGTVSLIAHFMSIAAFRYANASTLAPLVYFELVSGIALGYFVFGDIPTAMVWAGVALIVLGGLAVIRARSED